VRNEGKWNHAKLDHLWVGPFRIDDHCGKNAYFLEGLDGYIFDWGVVNNRFLKHYLMK
jgi:hypothetical protein